MATARLGWWEASRPFWDEERSGVSSPCPCMDPGFLLAPSQGLGQPPAHPTASSHDALIADLTIAFQSIHRPCLCPSAAGWRLRFQRS